MAAIPPSVPEFFIVLTGEIDPRHSYKIVIKPQEYSRGTIHSKTDKSRRVLYAGLTNPTHLVYDVAIKTFLDGPLTVSFKREGWHKQLLVERKQFKPLHPVKVDIKIKGRVQDLDKTYKAYVLVLNFKDIQASTATIQKGNTNDFELVALDVTALLPCDSEPQKLLKSFEKLRVVVEQRDRQKVLNFISDEGGVAKPQVLLTLSSDDESSQNANTHFLSTDPPIDLPILAIANVSSPTSSSAPAVSSTSTPSFSGQSSSASLTCAITKGTGSHASESASSTSELSSNVAALTASYFSLRNAEPSIVFQQQHALKPWHPYCDLPHEADEKAYRFLEAAKEDKMRVVHWYQQHPVQGMTIKNIRVIFNAMLTKAFEAKVKFLETRHGDPRFVAPWKSSGSISERKKCQATMNLLDQMSQRYMDPANPHVTLVPMWHATKREYVDMIASHGYHVTPLRSFVEPGLGNFGRGIYTTGEASYAADFVQSVSKGALLVNWVAFYSALPFIKGNEGKLTVKEDIQPYDAVFFPVIRNDSLSNHKGLLKQSTELVVYNEDQVLPSYLVELQAELGLEIGMGSNVNVGDFVVALLKIKMILPEDSLLHKIIDGKLKDYNGIQRALNQREQAVYILAQGIDGLKMANKSQVIHAALSYLEEQAPVNANEVLALNSKHQDLLEAINANPEAFENYLDLSNSIQKGEIITLINGKKMDKLKLQLESLQWNPKYAFPSTERFLLPEGRALSKKELCLEILNLDPEYSQAYSILATTLFTEAETILLPDERELNSRQLYREAIRCDELNTYAYVGLATLLKPAERINIAGQEMGKREFLLKALELNPKNSYAQCHLALLLFDDSSIVPSSFMQRKRRELLLESLKLNPKNLIALNCLADTLSDDDDDIIRLPGIDENLFKRSIYLKILEWHSSDTQAWIGLGRLLSIHESVRCKDGRYIDKRTALLEALKHNPICYNAYAILADTLQSEESIKLFDGRFMSKKDLYLEAIKWNPTNARAFCDLAQTLNNNENIILPTKQERMTKRALLLEAIKLDPQLVQPYFHLANTLAEGEIIVLADGRQMNAKTLSQIAKINYKNYPIFSH